MGAEDVVLIDVSLLIPIEDHSDARSHRIGDKINQEGVWTKPILVAKDHMLVLDGHHRFSFAKRVGLKKIPAIVVAYEDIKIRSLRKEISFTHEDVIRNAKCHQIYPYKTVKHDLEFNLPKIKVDLSSLK